MTTKTKQSMLEVRESWSEEERQLRQDLADAMQFQLRALVVLSELSDGKGEHQEVQCISMASAC